MSTSGGQVASASAGSVVNVYKNDGVGGSGTVKKGDAVWQDPAAPNEALIGDASENFSSVIIGLVLDDGPIAWGDPVRILSAGLLTGVGAGAFVIGQRVYLSTTGSTGNTLTTTPPSSLGESIVELGIAKNTNDLQVSIREPIEL